MDRVDFSVRPQGVGGSAVIEPRLLDIHTVPSSWVERIGEFQRNISARGVIEREQHIEESNGKWTLVPYCASHPPLTKQHGSSIWNHILCWKSHFLEHINQNFIFFFPNGKQRRLENWWMAGGGKKVLECLYHPTTLDMVGGEIRGGGGKKL